MENSLDICYLRGWDVVVYAKLLISQVLLWFGQCCALRHCWPRDFRLRSHFSDSRSLRLRRMVERVAALRNFRSALSAHEH